MITEQKEKWYMLFDDGILVDASIGCLTWNRKYRYVDLVAEGEVDDRLLQQIELFLG